MNKTCTHRHKYGDGSRHDNCFKEAWNGEMIAKGKDELEEPFLSQWYGKYNKDTGRLPRIGYFDLEFSDFKADYGYITAWSIKERNNDDIITASLTQKEIGNGELDKRLIKEFAENMTKFDLLVGYYSSMADTPYIRSKIMYYGYEFPTPKTMNHLDIYFAIRGKVSTNSKSLKSICSYFGNNEKVDLTAREWLEAKLAYPETMKKLIDRNRHDCSMLEWLHKRFEGVVKFNRNWL